MTSYKQVIVLRENLGMSKGKMIAQACHASLNAYKKASKQKVEEWESEGAKKIALNGGNLEELASQAKTLEIPAYLVSDAGLTELKPGTKTALGLGPDKEDRINKITGDLELIN